MTFAALPERTRPIARLMAHVFVSFSEWSFVPDVASQLNILELCVFVCRIDGCGKGASLGSFGNLGYFFAKLGISFLRITHYYRTLLQKRATWNHHAKLAALFPASLSQKDRPLDT